jgi:hypothetical protein
MIAFAIRWRIPRLSDWEAIQIMLAGSGPCVVAFGVTYPFKKESNAVLRFIIRFAIWAPLLVAVLHAIRLQKQLP